MKQCVFLWVWLSGHLRAINAKESNQSKLTKSSNTCWQMATDVCMQVALLHADPVELASS